MFKSIIGYPAGFAIGTETGMVRFYEKHSEKNEFSLLRNWTNKDQKGFKITGMSYHEVCSTEKILAIANKNNNVVYLNLVGQIYQDEGKSKHSYEDEEHLRAHDIANENI